jgi:hypothetical protein
MKTLLKLLCLTFLTWSCASRIHSGPDCLSAALDDFQTWCCTSSAHVDEYQFQGQPVYLFEPGTCGADMPTYVLDAQCDTLGFLGGFAGFTQIQGLDFASNSSFQGTIWHN